MDLRSWVIILEESEVRISTTDTKANSLTCGAVKGSNGVAVSGNDLGDAVILASA